MEKLFLLQHRFSGDIFNGILPEEIEFYIFKIVWHIKISKFNLFYINMYNQLQDLSLPLTENCTVEQSLDLFESSNLIEILHKSITNYQKKKLTSPYKWWNTRLPLNFTYKQIYFTNQLTNLFDNNWYYQENYDIVCTRFRVKYLQHKNMKITEFNNSRNNTKFVKIFKNYDLNDEDWKNRGLNNPNFSIYPEYFKNKEIIYHYNIDEEYPLQFDHICYYQK